MPRRTQSKPGWFVTGTDTGVGKTEIACALLRGLRSAGHDAVGFKPIVTGAEIGRDGKPHWSDAEQHWVASDKVEPLEKIAPLRFRTPCAPVPAAKLDGQRVKFDLARAAYRELRARHEWLVVEGIGGLLVPLDHQTLVADFIAETELPVVLVARAGLGVISHTLLALSELQRRKLRISKVFLNVTRPEDGANALQSRPEIERHARLKITILPYRATRRDWRLRIPPFQETT